MPVMTGTRATWMLELDDSLKRYLSEPESDEARDVVRGQVKNRA